MGLAAILSCDKHYVDEFLSTCKYKLTFKNLYENGPVVSEKASLNFHT